MATTITANGINFPDGSAGSPSIGGTDTNTGLFTGSDIIGFSTGGSERLRIDASGYVGIGNTSMGSYHSKNLVINSHDNGGITLVSAANEASGITFADGTGTPDKYTGFIQYDHSNNAITFGTNGGSERLRIDASGNINIANDSGKLQLGTSNDLQIYHNGSYSIIDHGGTGDLYIESQNNFELHVANGEDALKATANGAVELYYDNSKKLETWAGGIKLNGVENAGSQLMIGASNDFAIEHDGSNTYLANSTGDLVLQNDANVKITAKAGGTQRFRFDTDGLKFGTDTAAANALDDYEEGVFTVGVSCQSGSVTLHSSYNQASYTKIGRLVHVMAYLAVTSVNGPSGTLSLTGLPFTSADTQDKSGAARFPISMYLNGSALPDGQGTYTTSGYINEGVTELQVNFLGTNTNGKQTTSCANQISNGADFFLNFSYITST